MNIYTTSPDIVKQSLLTLWSGVAGFVPRLVAALIVFLIGWLIAIALGKVAWHLIKLIQLDRALESTGFKMVWERSGRKLDTPLFFYELVKWFFIVVFLMAATNILGLDDVTTFLQRVVNYIPHVFVAAIILIAGVLVARFLGHAVHGSARAGQLGSGAYLSTVARWSVMVVAVLADLEQLQIADYILKTAETGVIVAAALAIGLAFGLGGKNHAEEVIAKMRKKLED